MPVTLEGEMMRISWSIACCVASSNDDLNQQFLWMEWAPIPVTSSTQLLWVSKEFCGCDNGCFHCSLASLDTAAESILACVVYTLSLMIMLISHCTVLSTKPCNWQYSLSFDHLSWYHPRHYIAEAGPLRVALMGLISSPLLLRSPIFQSPFWVENHVVKPPFLWVRSVRSPFFCLVQARDLQPRPRRWVTTKDPWGILRHPDGQVRPWQDYAST